MHLFLLITKYLVKAIYSLPECPATCNLRLGDNYCDLICNNQLCGFDSPTREILSSDCIYSCLSSGCSLFLLQNQICDEQCNTAECGFDAGFCSPCSVGCTSSMLQNTKCDLPCSTAACDYDSGLCGICSSGCTAEKLNSPKCESECDAESCKGFVQNKCFASCSAGCGREKQENGVCDEECNNEACSYDLGKCLCHPECTPQVLSQGGCSGPCATKECSFKNGLCGHCALACFEEMLGDGICQQECNNLACNFDYFDCGCAQGCSVTFLDGAWQNQKSNKNNLKCLVSSCLYGTGLEIDQIDRKFKLLQDLDEENWDYKDNVYPQGCSKSQLEIFDQNSKTCEDNDPCMNSNAVWCLGLNSKLSGNCLRASASKCLVCSGFMVLDECHDSIASCPAGFIKSEELSELFRSENSVVHWCWPDPRNLLYHYKNPHKIFVSSSPSPQLSGQGSEADPYLSLYMAFARIFSSFTLISLNTGKFFYQTDEKAEIVLRPNPLDPISFKSDRKLVQLKICGSEVGRTVVEWKGKVVISAGNFETLVIQNVWFSGRQILRNNCDGSTDLCFYCPALLNQDYMINDKLVKVPESLSTLYGTSCESFNDHELFVFQKESLLINVTFEYFRHQFKSLISAKGTLNFFNVSFIKIQPKDGGLVLNLLCSESCIEKDFNFENGVVQDLNFGYEDGISSLSGNFLKVEGFHSISLKNLRFLYNYAVSVKSPAYLMSFLNYFGSLSISNCTFLANYLDNLLLIDSRSLKYSDLLINYKGFSESHSQTHLSIKNSTFQHVYTKSSMIFYSSENILQNLELTNLNFLNVFSPEIITFKHTGPLLFNQTMIRTSQNSFALFPAKLLRISNMVVFNSSAENSIISVEGHPSLILDRISIKNVKNNSKEILAGIIDEFIMNEKYLSLKSVKFYPNLSAAITLVRSCEVSVLSSQFITLNSQVLMITNIQNEVSLRNLTIFDLKINSNEDVALKIENIYGRVKIEDFHLESGVNQGGGVVSLSNIPSLYLVASSLASTISSFSPLALKNISEILINSLKISNSTTSKNSGGCMNIDLSTSSKVSIKSSLFHNCSSQKEGGCLNIERGELFLNLTDTSFISCSSLTFSALYVSNDVRFLGNSEISSISMTGTKQGRYLVSLNHNSGLLTLRNWTVFNNSAGVLFCELIYGEYLLTISDFKVNFIDSALYLFTFSQSSVLMTKVTISNSYSTYMFMINTVRSKVNASELTLVNNSAGILATEGSVIQLTKGKFSRMDQGINIITQSKVFCDFCVFSYLTQSAIWSSKGFFSVNNSLISWNSASSYNKPLIFLELSEADSTSFIENSEIQLNEAKNSEIMMVVHSNLKVFSTVFKENTASSDFSPGIYVMQSKVLIEKCLFSQQTTERYASFIYSTDNSELSIKDSSFTGAYSALDGGALYTYDTLLKIEGTTFENTHTDRFGGSIYASFSSLELKSVKIFNTSALQGTGIYVYSSTAQVLSSFILNQFSKSSLPDSPCSFYLESCQSIFINSSDFSSPASDLSALCVSKTSSSLITHSKFEDFQSDSGSLSFTSVNQANLKNCIIRNNTSSAEGGGIKSIDSNLVISSSSINSNLAAVGGGIYFESPSCKRCFLTVNSSTISNNSALSEGGGIKWLDNEPRISKDSKLFNNSAKYGSDLGSRGVKLFKAGSSRSLAGLSYQYEMSEVSPGQLYLNTFPIGIYDIYDQLVTTDSQSRLTLSTIPEFPDLQVEGSVNFQARGGLFELTGFIPYAQPGSSHVFKAQSDFSAGADESTEIFIKISFRQCIAGEKIELNMCKVCPQFQYLLQPAKKCKVCPDGGICNGGQQLFPDKGHYRPSNSSDRIYKCWIRDACEGNPSGSESICREGYQGIKCGVCSAEYLKSPKGRCRKCANRKFEGVLIILTLLSLAFGSYWLSSSALTSALDGLLHYTAYMKLFLDFLHMNYFLSLLKLNWPSYVQNFLDLFRFPGTAIEFVFSAECFLYDSDENFIENSYYYRLAAVISLPFAIYAISAVIWLGFGFLNETWLYLKRELFLTFFSVFYIFYPNVILMCLNHLACEHVDTLGTFLQANPAVECWTSRHKKYSLMFALPGVIIWGLTIPAICMILIMKRSRFLNNIENRVVFGFYLIGYRKHKFYWEFLVIFRKLLVMFLLVFFSQVSIFVQGVTISCFLLFFLFLQYENFPFSSPTTSHLQTELLSTVSASLFTGIYYMTGDLNWASRVFLFSVLTLLNFYFLALWLLCVGYSIIEFFLARVPRVKELLKKGDSFTEDFNKEEIDRNGLLVDPGDGEIVYTFLKRSPEKQQSLKLRTLKQLFSVVLLATKENDDLSDQDRSEISLNNSLDFEDFEPNGKFQEVAEEANLTAADILMDLNANDEKKFEIPDEFQESDQEQTEKNKEKNRGDKYFKKERKKNRKKNNKLG